MELKYVFGSVAGGTNKFELNLYGIEIYSVCQSLTTYGMFELNLYGIEMWFCVAEERRDFVWIEPLWNWNVADAMNVCNIL